MRTMILGFATLAILAASPAFAQDAALIEKGVQVYADQRCRLCHSIGDEGNSKGPLDDVGARLSVEEITAWIEDSKGMTESTGAARKPAMKQFDLPDDEVGAVVAYLSSLKGS